MLGALFAEETKENVFLDSMLRTIKNAKFLRNRIYYSNAKKLEKIECYDKLSVALEISSLLLYRVSRNSSKYKHYTHEDFLMLLFIDPNKDNLPYEFATMSELRSHHDNVSASISGIFLAYNNIIRKHRDLANKIISNIKESHIILQRLK